LIWKAPKVSQQNNANLALLLRPASRHRHDAILALLFRPASQYSRNLECLTCQLDIKHSPTLILG